MAKKNVFSYQTGENLYNTFFWWHALWKYVLYKIPRKGFRLSSEDVEIWNFGESTNGLPRHRVFIKLVPRTGRMHAGSTQLREKRRFRHCFRFSQCEGTEFGSGKESTIPKSGPKKCIMYYTFFKNVLYKKNV